MAWIGQYEGLRHSLLVLFLLAHCVVFFAVADDFFLKASKSVPRIGRRSFGGSRVGGGVRTITADLDHGFFMKAAKSVPRIGRRRTAHPLALGGVAEGQDWGLVWPWYRTMDSAPGPSYAEVEPSWMMQRRSEEEPDSIDGLSEWKQGAKETLMEGETGGEEESEQGTRRNSEAIK